MTKTQSKSPKPQAETAQAILKEIKPLGAEGYSQILRKHGARDPIYGVKISELKKIQKRVRKNYALALDLYDTGVYDAMYLAGLIADDMQMTKKDLQGWVEKAYCAPLTNSVVAWVAAEGQYGHELALQWIESKKENIATTGWATLNGLVSIKDDAQLDLATLKQLLARVQKTIHNQPNDVRAAMNNFVIAVGSYVKTLAPDALRAAAGMGEVMVDKGDTACKVPDAAEYIRKAQQRGTLDKKRKTVKC